MITKQAIAIVRQAVREMRTMKAASCRPMQKKAFTAVELGVAAPILAALGYGGYKTVQRLGNNPGARTRGAVGTGIGAAGGSLAVLGSLLSKGRLKPGMLRAAGRATTAGGIGGGALGGLVGTWTPGKTQP